MKRKKGRHQWNNKKRLWEKEGCNCNSFPARAPGVLWVRLIPKASKNGNAGIQSYVCRERKGWGSVRGSGGEAESLLIFWAMSWDERLLSYLQVHEHNEIFILLSAACERDRVSTHHAQNAFRSAVCAQSAQCVCFTIVKSHLWVWGRDTCQLESGSFLSASLLATTPLISHDFH